jgi:hypothetical protein
MTTSSDNDYPPDDDNLLMEELRRKEEKLTAEMFGAVSEPKEMLNVLLNFSFIMKRRVF